MKHTIINTDVIEGLRSLPEKSIHCVVTSPPYWGLRDYGVEGQIGLEPSLDEHISKIVDVFREVRRVLRDDGTVWLNYGDMYSTDHGFSNKQGNTDFDRPCREQITRPRLSGFFLPEKNLIGLPWRIAFALQEDGWYLRSDIIWSKPNPMPESVTDRPTKSHEYIFLLTKQARYFYDADAVREEQTGNSHSKGTCIIPKAARPGEGIRANDSFLMATKELPAPRDGMRNRRTVWEIPTQPTPVAHFATFPEALVEPCIKAGTSEYGCCPVCGAPWVRIVTAEGGTIGKSWHDHKNDLVNGQKAPPGKMFEDYRRNTSGWKASCDCGNGPAPCRVLDPFGGSGTVAKVARALNRSSVLIELNPEYVDIAKKRLNIGLQQTLPTGVIDYEVVKV